MLEVIQSNNLSEAWLRAMYILEQEKGETANLTVCLRPPVVECLAVTAALEGLLHLNPKALPIGKVAGTIFPHEFYLPERLGERAQQHLYENHILARIIEDRWNKKGNYFDRMVRWPGLDGNKINQLEKKICYYREEIGRGKRTCNAFEIAVSDPGGTCADEGGDIRIYDPEYDRGTIMGFPCLSHISISLTKNRLYMTAVYRNQHFLQKAYGNYLGLLRLLNFLAHEIGVEVGELVCIATHADDESGDPGFKRSNVKQLLSQCADLLKSEASVPVEISYVRPFVAKNRVAQAA